MTNYEKFEQIEKEIAIEISQLRAIAEIQDDFKMMLHMRRQITKVDRLKKDLYRICKLDYDAEYIEIFDL